MCPGTPRFLPWHSAPRLKLWHFFAGVEQGGERRWVHQRQAGKRPTFGQVIRGGGPMVIEPYDYGVPPGEVVYRIPVSPDAARNVRNHVETLIAQRDAGPFHLVGNTCFSPLKQVLQRAGVTIPWWASQSSLLMFTWLSCGGAGASLVQEPGWVQTAPPAPPLAPGVPRLAG
jgi:hypothetical protein